MNNEINDDIRDIHRSLEDAEVTQMSSDESLNIDLAEYDGYPPRKPKSIAEIKRLRKQKENY